MCINAADAGTRLDKWLADNLPNRSRAEIQRWIAGGRVLVNCQLPKISYRLAADDVVAVKVADGSPQPNLRAEPVHLDIVWEDSDCIVINKAAGMAVHPGAGRDTGTLANALVHYLPSLSGVGASDRPGIVHRLDMDTSGAMVVAKHEAALDHLQRQFRQRTVFKEYLAVVEGRLEPTTGRIDAAIMRRPGRSHRQVAENFEQTTHHSARRAITDYAVEAVYAAPVHGANAVGNFTFLRAHPITGRTHQLRVHFAWLKHPVIGDAMYGIHKQRLVTSRMFLHAHRLRFRLMDETTKEFVIPLPNDLAEVLTKLANSSPTGL